MVALRRFQDLMRMLACQTPASTAPASPTKLNAMNKSTQTPDPRLQSKNSRTIVSLPYNPPRRQNFTLPNTSSHIREQNRLSRQMQRRNTSICSNQYHDIISSDELLSQKQYNTLLNSSVITNYAKNRVVSGCNNNIRRRRTVSVAPNKNNHNCTYNDDNYLEKSPIKKTRDNNFIKNSDRSMKVLNRNNTIKTPPVKDHKFSRYTPLPAINQGDYHLAIKKQSPERQRQNRRLTRQLTYKVINPLFVKGPLDLPGSLNKSPNRNSLKKSSRCSTPVSHVVKRSKTIVIKKNKSVTTIPKDKDHKSNNLNSKSVSYPNTSVGNQMKETDRNARKSLLMNRGKSFVIPKKFIEAAEKIKDGEPIVDNAFWIEL